MPNQLASTKRRQSLAEHEAVLRALAEIARREGTTTMALLRQAARALVRDRAADPASAEWLRSAVMTCAPTVPERFATPSKLARFKCHRREFDELLLDLNLASPDTVQARNSVVSPHCRVRILNLERSHAGSANR